MTPTMDPHISNQGESRVATHPPLDNLADQAKLRQTNQKQGERAPEKQNSKLLTSSSSSPPATPQGEPSPPTPLPSKPSPPAEEEENQPKMLESIDEMGGESGLLGVLLALLFGFAAAAAAVAKLSWPVLATVVVLVFSGVIYRHHTLSSSRGRGRAQLFPPSARPAAPSASSRDDNILGCVPAYFLFVLGSGGHTTEMFETIKNSFAPTPHQHRRYVLTTGDGDSLRRLLSLESFVDWAFLSSSGDSLASARVGTRDTFTIPRARKVHQPLWSAPFTCLATAIQAVKALSMVPGQRAGEGGLYKWPHVIVTNGPGTGFIVALVGYLLKVIGVMPGDRGKVVYIESWARIKSLSLTGRMFYWTGIAEVFGVQHRGLCERYKGVVYVGEVGAARGARMDEGGS